MARQCIERYKDRKTFLSLFQPKYQYQYTRDLRKVYMGEAPTLGTLTRAFGQQVTEAWIEYQLIDLSEYAGCRDKLNTFQLDSIAQVIMSRWGYFKVTELMHFFLLMKGGEYGHFYAGIDGMIINEAINKYNKTRCELIDRYQQEEEKEYRAAEDAIHAKAVKRFNSLVKRSMLSHLEFIKLANEYNLPHEELAELGWLFRLGYESK